MYHLVWHPECSITGEESSDWSVVGHVTEYWSLIGYLSQRRAHADPEDENQLEQSWKKMINDNRIREDADEGMEDAVKAERHSKSDATAKYKRLWRHLPLKMKQYLWCLWRMWRVCWRRSTRTCSSPAPDTRTQTRGAARRWGRTSCGWSRGWSCPRVLSHWSSLLHPEEMRHQPAAIRKYY